MSEIIPVSGVTDVPARQDKSTGISGFGDFLTGAVSSVGSLVGDVSSLGGGLGMSTDLFSLIEKQQQLQVEMETVSMISNIDKSKHESKMAAIRNIRTS